MSKETRLLKNTAIIALGNLCTKGITFLLLPLYTSLLTTAEYGTVDLITSYIGLLTVFLSLQLDQGLFRFLVEARGNPPKQKAYILAALSSVVILLGIFSLSAGVVLERYGYPFTGYLLLNTAAGVLNAILLQIPRGLGDTVTYAAASTLSGACNVVLNVVFIALLRLGVEGMLAANLLALSVSAVYVIWKVRLHRYLDVRGFDTLSLRELLKFSLPLIPYTLCWWVIGAADRLVINHVLGVAHNGIYAVANKFPGLFTMASGIFQTAWMESAYESADDCERSRYYEKMINGAVRFYLACCLCVTAVLPFLFSCIVHEDYLDAYRYVPILLLAAMVHAVSAMYGSVYFALKQVNKVVYTTVLATVINFLINILLIRKIGLYAAALSTLAAYLCILLFRYFHMRRLMGIVISGRFLSSAGVAAAPVLFGYYSGIAAVQWVALASVILWSVFCNRELMDGILNKVREKVRK